MRNSFSLRSRRFRPLAKEPPIKIAEIIRSRIDSGSQKKEFYVRWTSDAKTWEPEIRVPLQLQKQYELKKEPVNKLVNNDNKSNLSKDESKKSKNSIPLRSPSARLAKRRQNISTSTDLIDELLAELAKIDLKKSATTRTTDTIHSKKTVSKDEFAAPKELLKDSYSIVGHRNISKKEECNEFFTKHAAELLQIYKSNCGVLDGEKMITSSNLFNKLQKLGWTAEAIKNAIHVPNASESYNLMKNTKYAHVYQCFLSEFLLKTDLKFTALWFDYMCTLKGNKRIDPLRDFETALKRGIFENESIFAITCCSRARMKRTKSMINKTFSNIVKEFTGLAYKYNYKMAMTEEICYSSMVFVCFKLKKIN